MGDLPADKIMVCCARCLARVGDPRTYFARGQRSTNPDGVKWEFWANRRVGSEDPVAEFTVTSVDGTRKVAYRKFDAPIPCPDTACSHSMRLKVTTLVRQCDDALAKNLSAIYV